MHKKFLHKIMIFTLSLGVLVSMGSANLNARGRIKACPFHDGIYKNTCEDISVTHNKKKNKCTVKATCKFDENTRYGDVFNCGHKRFGKENTFYNFCNAHWEWDISQPAPKLKNKD